MHERLIEAVTRWASGRDDIRALALVGSHARGAATPGSDIDFVIVAAQPERLLQDTSWITRFGTPSKWAPEDYGLVTSIRVFYDGGPEVEFGVASGQWTALPLDPGTRQVIRDGCRVLHDPDGLLATILDAAR